MKIFSHIRKQKAVSASLWLLGICLVLPLAGCSGRYIGQPREAMLAYQTYPTYGSLYTLASAYADNINAAVAAVAVCSTSK